jgi:hypothetical protein
VTAAIGVAAGYGYLLLAALVAGPVTLTLLLLGSAERRLEVGGWERDEGSLPSDDPHDTTPEP